ncbi:AbrB/MazE/SpoVT family DNA-binding domain-containing protein [Candidatus Collierbacteria bacterium]|nr:AbrB/MazE/SpoVT family DNA-binding domain-containing protein [Candidatus Collierbacteria bacterium]
MIYTAVIRQRGQLTIPDQVRDMLVWLREGSVVGIDIDSEEVRIKPHSRAKKDVDWDGFFSKVQLARSFKGKRGNLSSIIVDDRENH